MTKRKLYIFCTILLGGLLQFLMHAGLEIWYLGLLEQNFAAYSMGFSWQQLLYIHHVLAVVLFFLGIAFGYKLGVVWWNIVYVQRRHWLLKRE